MENSPVTGKRKLTGPDSTDILSQPSKSKISEIAVESKIVSRTCVHEVTVLCYCNSPKGETFHHTDKNPIYGGKMSNKYILVLYPFSVAFLEGKATVAEYAMVMYFHDDQRAIYTSALMALSNQEYSELNQELSDVWLMAGDVASPYSSCVVLNTENYGGMPYSSSKLLKVATLVIFDEIHYTKDRVRVVVWEETIIFLPAASKKFIETPVPRLCNTTYIKGAIGEHIITMLGITYAARRTNFDQQQLRAAITYYKKNGRIIIKYL